MDFHVKLGFPRLVKILLGTGVMIVLGANLGLGRLIVSNRLSRSKKSKMTDPRSLEFH